MQCKLFFIFFSILRAKMRQTEKKRYFNKALGRSFVMWDTLFDLRGSVKHSPLHDYNDKKNYI
jgi:hypothetical protein